MARDSVRSKGSLKIATILGTFLIAASRPGFGQSSGKESRAGVLDIERVVGLVEAITDQTPSRPSILGGVDLASSPENRHVAQILRTLRVSVTLKDRGPLDAVRCMEQLSGLDIVVTRRARRALEEENPAVHLTLRDLPLENVMNLLARQLGSCGFTVRHGTVLLVHRDENRPRRLLRFYRIHDIVRPRTDFRAPRLGLEGLEER